MPLIKRNRLQRFSCEARLFRRFCKEVLTAQCVAYENLNKDSRKLYPYLLDIQSNLLEDLETTTVIPLTNIQTVTKKFTKLTPVVEVHRAKHLAMTQQIAGLNRTLLGKPVDDLSMYRFAIVDAMDFIILGI
jgi:toxin CcdB